MQLATVNAPAAEPEDESPASVLAAYAAHQSLTGRGNTAYDTAARSFLRRWPQVQIWAEVPLERQLAANGATRPFITFLMVSRRLRPGYDYLLARKLSSFWRDLTGSALQTDLDRFVAAAKELGFAQRVGSAIASQVIARLLIQTGRDLDQLTPADFDDLAAAGMQREQRTGRPWRHYRVTCHSARQVLFHLAILDSPNPPATVPLSLEQRMAEVPEVLQAAFVGYLQRKSATCRPKTVSSLATRLTHFGRFLSQIDPDLTSLAGLDRRRHIEPFISSLLEAISSTTGEPISIARSGPSHPRRQQLPGRDHRVGLGRRASTQAAVHLRPAPAAPAVAPLPAGRRRPSAQRSADGLAESPGRRRAAAATGLRATDRGTARSRARRRPRDPRAGLLVEGAPRQARHRTDGPAR